MTRYLPAIVEDDESFVDLLPLEPRPIRQSSEITRIGHRSEAQQFALDMETEKALKAHRNTTAVSGNSVELQGTLANHAEDIVERQDRPPVREKIEMVADQAFKTNNRALGKIFGAYERAVVAIINTPVTPPPDSRGRLQRLADDVTNAITSGIPER